MNVGGGGGGGSMKVLILKFKTPHLKQNHFLFLNFLSIIRRPSTRFSHSVVYSGNRDFRLFVNHFL